MDIKEKLKERFLNLYPGKRLLAIKLDGFSHHVWYDDGSKDDEIIIEEYSQCAPELFDKNSKVGQLLGDIGHSCYQCNPAGFVYVFPEDR